MSALGKLGAIPGYPGESVAAPQPMIAQTRDVLAKYQANGGSFTEFVIENTGHSPYVEKPDVFNKRFQEFLQWKLE